MQNPNRQFKDAIYEQFSRIGKAVSSPKRLELLDLLCQGAKNVETLARETGLTLANASQHLQTLRAARLIEAQKEGLHVTYQLCDPKVCAFFRSMRVLAESQLAEIEMIKRRFLENREGMEPVDRNDLLERVKQGAVTVLDVRPVEEYRAGHIPAKQATWDDVIAEADAGGYRIITTEALAEKYRKDPSDLMLIDTRQEWEYRTGHIKGASIFHGAHLVGALARRTNWRHFWDRTRTAPSSSTERA
jgi:rhodanese-related sulfurtransferase/DNA-binding transcriptional ArsR family regulator